MHVVDAFFHPTEPADVARAQRRLADPGDPERSHGRVRKPETFHRSVGGFQTERDGLHCQRIFGPTADLRCLCGRLEGAEHEGESCERCGVLCGSSALRTTRLGHVEIAPCVHPGAFGPIADLLGWPIEDVVAVAHGEAWFADGVRRPERDAEGFAAEEASDHQDASGPIGLLNAVRARDAGLADAATVTRVPVTPPADRPLVRAAGRTAVHAFPGGIDAAYVELITRANRLARLIELGVPPVVEWSERRLLQQALEACVEAVAGRATALSPPWYVDEPPAILRPWPRPTRVPEGADDRVHGLLWVDDGRILVDRAHGSWLVSPAGEVLRTFPPSGRVAIGVRGDRVVYGPWIGWLYDWADDDWWNETLPEGERRSELGVLDLRTGGWAERWPDDLDAVEVGNDEPEDLLAVDRRTGRRLRLRWGGDRPGVLAKTRDGRFAWVGEDEDTAVIDIVTGEPHVQPPPSSGDPDDDLPLAGLGNPPDDDEDEDWYGSHAAAVGLTGADEWRFLHPTGALGDADALWVRLDLRSEASAFDPGAARLALANEGEMTIVSVEPQPRVLARFALP